MAGVVAGIRDDTDRYRYRYEHQLVRASGIGDWARVLQEILAGPAYGLLAEPFQESVNTLNKSYPTGDRSWQCQAIEKAIEALSVVRPEVSAPQGGLRSNGRADCGLLSSSRPAGCTSAHTKHRDPTDRRRHLEVWGDEHASASGTDPRINFGRYVPGHGCMHSQTIDRLTQMN